MVRFLIIIGLVFIATSLEAARVYEPPYQTLDLNEHSIKTINYALKVENKLVLKTVGVKNPDLMGEPNWIGQGIWTKNYYNSTGWALLEIETNEKADNYEQAFTAGYLEGSLSREFISLHLINTVGDFCKENSTTGVCSKLIDFLNNNLKWLSSQIAQHKDDPYWHQVELALTQFVGLWHGYYGYSADLSNLPKLTHSIVNDIRPYLDLMALQLNGDMSELFASFLKVSDPFMAGSCSALVKLLPNNQDIFVSHDTWTNYESMLRILKHFKLKYHLNNIDPTLIPGWEVSYSSYPGILVSIDDFYVLNTHLVVMETTIGNANPDLWKYVKADTILYWIRILAANRLAYTGVDWAKLFSLYNSGTYNNEWMVVDYKNFYPGEKLTENTFIVLEQIPGQVVWTDKTDFLQSKTYWPSYNLAYYPEVYNISGTYDSFTKYGDFFSYEKSPRAQIFRRDHSKVTDVPSMINLMRYCNYTKEPLSGCDKCSPPYSGENTIAARSDLNPASGKYPFDALGHRDHGATDMKMTSFSLSRQAEFVAVSGPPYDNEDVTPFAWSKADFGNSTKHFGLPDVWKFKPILVKWAL